MYVCVILVMFIFCFSVLMTWFKSFLNSKKGFNQTVWISLLEGALEANAGGDYGDLHVHSLLPHVHVPRVKGPMKCNVMNLF